MCLAQWLLLWHKTLIVVLAEIYEISMLLLLLRRWRLCLLLISRLRLLSIY